MPKQRKPKTQQSSFLRTGAAAPNQKNGNRSYFLAPGHYFEALGITSKPIRWQQIVLGNQQQQIVFLSTGDFFETKTNATTRTFWHWGSTSKSKTWQQLVLLGIGVSLRRKNTGKKIAKSYFLAPVHHFEAETTATNRTS